MSFRLLLGSASVLALGASSLLWTTESTAFAANTESEESIEKHQILIIGGGTGGITAAAQIRRRMKNADVAIVDPSDVHYYQPLWTMVGGGLFSVKDSVKPMSAVVPSGCAWLKDSVITFDPESNTVQLASGRRLKYEYLVVAAGLQINYGAVKGLEETIGKNQVCSIYTRDQAEYVWETAQRVQEGLAIFTVPKTPIKCGGAPQKIMYLLEDHWRDQGLRAGADTKVRVAFAPSAATMFGVQHFGDKLNVIRQEKNIEAFFSHELVEVRGERKEAVFRTPEGEKIVEFSMLHVTPPMSAPDFLKTSPLVDANGYVEVDKYTLRHTRYPNVFSLGDCTNLPTSKTAAAIAGQAPVLVQNLQRVVDGQEPVAKYDGYSSCPIITGKNSLMLAEFLYDGVPVSSFPGDNRVPRLAFFLLKKYGFPFAYWNLMLKGYWYGRHHLFEPRFF